MKPVVFLACTGLGHINRGYESFSRECFDALKKNEYFDFWLMKGGGKTTQNEIVIYNFRRESTTAKFLSRLLNKPSYLIEQFSFCFFLLPQIIKKKPTLIYYSDFLLGTYLWHLRRLLKFKYRLLFANGAPNEPPFKTEDHVQQLMPLYFNSAIAKGEPASKQTLLPYGFNINMQQRLNAVATKNKIRAEKGFSPEQKIILSIGAVNAHHKRMDYIINETALLTDNYFLVILGQSEEETTRIKQLAADKLPGRYLIANLPYHEVSQYYIAADYFVLASLSEGFGRVLIESTSYGLPCIVHDAVWSKQVLHEYAIYTDMTKTGALANYLRSSNNKYSNAELVEAAYSLYSWDVLRKGYLKMIKNQLSFTN